MHIDAPIRRRPAWLRVREMAPHDLDGIERIERGVVPEAWDREALQRWIEEPGTIGWVALRNVQLVGFLILAARFGDGHIVNVAVHPAYRRQGIGAELVEVAETAARDLGMERLRLEVRESNLIAQVFYRALGFRAVEILPRFYAGTGEDAFLMEKEPVGIAEPAG